MNRELARARYRRWYASHREKAMQWNREYRQENRDHVNAADRKRYAKHAEEARAIRARWQSGDQL